MYGIEIPNGELYFKQAIGQFTQAVEVGTVNPCDRQGRPMVR